MKVSVDEASRTLRSLDPAGSLDAATPSQLDAALSRFMETDDAIVVGVFEDHATRRQRRLTLPLLAASVVLLIAAAIGLVAARHDPSSETRDALGVPSNVFGPPASAPPGVSLLPAEKDPNYRRALIVARAVAATEPTLPGASETSTAPLAVLKSRAYSNADLLAGHFATTAGRYWLAPGTVAQALDYLESHAPAGAEIDGSGGSLHPEDGTPQSVTFDGFGPSASVTFNVARVHSGVAVSASVIVDWDSTRPAGLYIGKVDTVDVVVDRTDRFPGMKAVRTIRTTLSGPSAQQLASLVNESPIGTPVLPSCPLAASFSDTLVFHSAGRTLTVMDHLGCGQFLDLSVDASQVQLIDNGSLDKLLMTILGLPQNYGN